MKLTTNLFESNVKEQEATHVPQEWNQNNNIDQGEVLVSVKNVSKKFCRKLRRSMAYGISDLSKNLLGLKPDTSTLRQDEFWALDDVSVDLRQGDTLGIIGVNGSGKTTLLRLLAGIFPPDKGEIIVKGRVGALVAVGSGFHPHMTGRENIYLNGTILGMSKKEIQTKFEDIVEFSEIGEFLDAPVSTYSSGMRVRLGFSIALHCAPDILLVDEVLSVGDIGFRNKSLRRMNDYREQANAVIFVSHQLEQIRALCSRVIILDKGRIVYDGATHEGCVSYQEMVKEMHLEGLICEELQLRDKRVKSRLSSFEEFELIDLGILNTRHQKIKKIAMDDPLIVYLDIKAKKETENIYLNVAILNEENQNCIWVTSKDKNTVRFPSLKVGRIYRIIIEIQEHHLMPDVYKPALSIRSDKTGETYERIWSDSAFQVVTDGNMLAKGTIAVKAKWTFERLD